MADFNGKCRNIYHGSSGLGIRDVRLKSANHRFTIGLYGLIWDAICAPRIPLWWGRLKNRDPGA